MSFSASSLSRVEESYECWLQRLRSRSAVLCNSNDPTAITSDVQCHHSRFNIADITSFQMLKEPPMRFAFLLAFFLTFAVEASRTSAGTEDQAVNQIFADYAKAGSPGCAVGVIRNGKFIYRKGYGMASLELDVPLSSQSVFYMGSVSKQFTAASVVLAAEQGFLSLDDNVRKYIPELPDYGQPITLRQMLHHTSGFRDVLALLALSGRNAEDLHPTAELLDLVARQKALNYKPGEEYQYSNTNYFLLGEVIKRATKKPLSEFAVENIFRPLGMAHTRFYDNHTLVVPGRVAAYSPGKDGAFLLSWSTNFEKVGDGGLMSSVDDLLLWDRNFYENKLGKGTLLKEMQSPGVFNNGQQSSYALGLQLGTYRGLPIVEHDGALFGYRTEILRFPEQRFTVVCLCNIANANPEGRSQKVAEIYLKKDLQSAPTVASASDSARFAGKYFDRDRHFLLSFAAMDGHLVRQGGVLTPIASNRFEGPIGYFSTFSSSNGAAEVTVNHDSQISFSGSKIEDLYPDAATLASYAGVYTSNELNATYKFSVEKGALVMRTNWEQPTNLDPVVPDEFLLYGGAATLVFRRDGNGHVSGFSVFTWAARNVSFERAN
jgi:CubicO group peptidase (beta-lactamase class C family)